MQETRRGSGAVSGRKWGLTPSASTLVAKIKAASQGSSEPQVEHARRAARQRAFAEWKLTGRDNDNRRHSAKEKPEYASGAPADCGGEGGGPVFGPGRECAECAGPVRKAALQDT